MIQVSVQEHTKDRRKTKVLIQVQEGQKWYFTTKPSRRTFLSPTIGLLLFQGLSEERRTAYSCYSPNDILYKHMEMMFD